MFAILAIVIAAIVGSVVGAFCEARLITLIWSAPLVALAEGVMVLAAPSVRDNSAAPQWLQQGMTDLGDPKLVLQTAMASLTATLVAWLLLHYVRQSRSLSGIPAGGRAPRRPAPAAPRRSDTALNRRIEDASSPRRPRPQAADAPQPIFEVEPMAPRPVPAPVPETPPRPPEPARPPDAEHRRSPRRRALLSGRLVFADGRSAACTIQNLSVSGAQVRLVAPTDIPSAAWLLDVSNGLAHWAEVAWRRDSRLGLKFRESFNLATSRDPRVGDLRQQWMALIPR